MKKFILFGYTTLWTLSVLAQDSYPDVKSIFNNKDDVDFILYKIQGYEEKIRYNIYNDTLTYSPDILSKYTISLRDVEFTESKIIIDTVYQKKNKEPAASLVITAKNDKYFKYNEDFYLDFSKYNFSKNIADKHKTLGLVFPNKEYAEKVKDYLFNLTEPNRNKTSSPPNQFSIFNSDLFSNLDKKTPSYVEPSHEELCSATTSMINDMQMNQLRNYLGSVASSETFYGVVLRKYNSKTNFPKATKTLINDTTALQKFRSVDILMAEETSTGQEISQAMYDYYVNIGGLLTSCLEQNKFTCDFNDPDPFNRSLMRAACSLQLTISQNSTINLLTTGSTIVVELTITQADNKNGNFTTQMNIKIMKV